MASGRMVGDGEMKERKKGVRHHEIFGIINFHLFQIIQHRKQFSDIFRVKDISMHKEERSNEGERDHQRTQFIFQRT